MWQQIGQNIGQYRVIQIVGPGGKRLCNGFVPQLMPNRWQQPYPEVPLSFRAKCSAAPGAYIPAFLVEKVEKHLTDDLKSFKMAALEDLAILSMQ